MDISVVVVVTVEIIIISLLLDYLKSNPRQHLAHQLYQKFQLEFQFQTFLIYSLAYSAYSVLYKHYYPQ